MCILKPIHATKIQEGIFPKPHPPPQTHSLQLTQFSLDWVNCLPVLRKLTLTEIGCVSVEVPRHFRGVLEGGAGRHNNLSHVTLNYPAELPGGNVLARILSHLTCFEVFVCYCTDLQFWNGEVYKLI